MSYFTPDTIQFLRELPANNNRDWFHENKKRYEKFVKQPFEKFITDFISLLKNEGLVLDEITAKDCIFRIHRDIRFSKDKTPYKIHVSALISSNGRKSVNSFGIYIELSGEHIRLYGGAYMPSSDILQKIRQKIYNEPERLTKLISAKKFKDNFGEIHGEENKRINKPFSEIVEKYPLILKKSYYYFKEYPTELILNEDLLKNLQQDFKIIQPLNAYFEEGINL